MAKKKRKGDLKQNLPPDEKLDRPKTLADAKNQIEETFASTGWESKEIGDEGWRDQQDYIKPLGLSGDWRAFGVDGVKKILDEFEKDRMILYKD